MFRVDGPGDALTIRDRRRGWPVRDHVLAGWARAAYEALDRPRAVKSLRAHLVEHGHDVDPAEVHAWLAGCRRDGLVFADNAAYVALATRDVALRATPSELAGREPVLAGR
jgi:hypothetical protein